MAIEMNPLNANAYLHRGMAKYALTDARGAIQDYNTTLQLQVNMEQAYVKRGQAKALIRDYTGAIADYNIATGLNSYDKDAFYLRGLAKTMAKVDQNGACLDFSKAGELGMAEAYVAIRTYCN